MQEEEAAEEFERATRKVGTEIGYLYMIGSIDGLFEWREDYLRSARNLIYRNTSTGTMTSCSVSVSSMSSLLMESDTEYSEDEREKEGDDIEFDEMDM